MNKIPAYKSGLLTIEQDNKGQGFFLPMTFFGTEETPDKHTFVLQGKYNQIEDFVDITKPINFTVDFTDDPTPEHAGSAVSLGYFVFRANLTDAKIECLNPLVVVCKPNNMKIRFNRTQRKSLIEPHNLPLVKTADVKVNDKSIFKKYFFLPLNYEGYLTIIGCILGEKFYVGKELLDITTFYSDAETVEFYTYKNQKQALKKYTKMLEKENKLFIERWSK